MKRLSLLGLTMLMSLTAAGVARGGLTLDVTSATSIDPAGGATIAYGGNANFISWTQMYSGASFNRVAPGDMKNKTGIAILNFESDNGFGSASQSLQSGGTIFSDATTMAPFSADQSIRRINIAGHYVDVSYCGYDIARRQLNTGVSGGVFLVGDRTSTPVMVSGSQGIIAGPRNAVDSGGILLSFDAPLQAFSVVENIGASSLNMIVVLIGENDAVLATYGLNADGSPTSTNSNKPLYFGVEAANADSWIKKVWIGERYNFDGLVIDDVAFQFAPVPEPAAAGIVFGGVVAGLLRRR